MAEVTIISSVAAVIVAAGRGERAGQSVEGPKQYRRIGGEAVLARTLRAFTACPLVDRIVVVIHPDDHALYERAFPGDHSNVLVVDGGATRQESTRLGLVALKEYAPQYVMIHDGVRPFVSQDLLGRIVGNLTPDEGVLPALAVSDTLKQSTPTERSRPRFLALGFSQLRRHKHSHMRLSSRHTRKPSRFIALISRMTLPLPNGKVSLSASSKARQTIRSSPGQRISKWLISA